MKKDYSVTSLAGALIWGAAMILRRLPMPDAGIIRDLLNALPKFGIVWLVVGLVITFWPQLFKKPFPANRVYLLIALSLLPIVLYKIVLPLVREYDIVFPPLDIVASLLAAGWLGVEHFLEQRNALSEEKDKDDEGAALEK